MKGTKARKVPAIRVSSDDFAVVIGEEEYRPHAGEWIEVRGKATVGDFLMASGLQQLQGLEEMTPDQFGELETLLEGVLRQLAASIAAWSWTDDRGEAMPSPPTAEMLRALSFEELAYVIGAVMGTTRTEATRKNGSSPST